MIGDKEPLEIVGDPDAVVCTDESCEVTDK